MAKVMVSIPDDVLEQIDAEARRRSTSRSALLTLAARHELQRRDPDMLAAVIARSRERFRDSGPFESTELVRAERDR
jgi:Ribbon-helix-helix protein, copG family